MWLIQAKTGLIHIFCAMNLRNLFDCHEVMQVGRPRRTAAVAFPIGSPVGGELEMDEFVEGLMQMTSGSAVPWSFGKRIEFCEKAFKKNRCFS